MTAESVSPSPATSTATIPQSNLGPPTTQHTLFLPDGSAVTAVVPAQGYVSGNNLIVFFKREIPSQKVTAEWTFFLSSPASPIPSVSADILKLIAAPPNSDYLWIIYTTLYHYFHHPAPPGNSASGKPRQRWQVAVDLNSIVPNTKPIYTALQQTGLVFLTNGKALCFQRSFWQLQYPFVKQPVPLVYTITDGTRHPIRPPAEEEIYRRHIPSVQAFLSFRCARLDDALMLNTWMNKPRVNAFWSQAGPIEKTQGFLARAISAMHVIPLIGCWESINGDAGGSRSVEPFGYFEIYWTKEDALGKYCETQDFERGIHVLVGEDRFRGAHRVRPWLSSLVHYIWQDDPRTMRISVEPRADDEKFISYLKDQGFYKEMEIELPQKQAALMRLTREAWDGPGI